MISITHGSLEPRPKNIKNCTNSTNISAFLHNSARYGSPSGLGSTFGIETNICHDVGTASAGRTFPTHGWVPLHQPWRCRKLTEDACGILYHDNFTKRKQGCWGSFILLTIISNHIHHLVVRSLGIQYRASHRLCPFYMSNLRPNRRGRKLVGHGGKERISRE